MKCYWDRGGAGFNMYATVGCNNRPMTKMPESKVCPYCNRKITFSYLFYLFSKLGK